MREHHQHTSIKIAIGGGCPAIFFVSLLLVLLPAAAGAKQLPYIFVITVDTLRRDHVGCYGYPKPTTPNIDALAQESVLFKNSFANASWTMPSYMSFLTGVYPGIHRTNNNKSLLPKHILTLPQRLRKEGYATGGIVSIPTLSSRFGFGRGYDFYDDFSVLKSKELNLFDEDDYETSVSESTTSALVTDYGINWIKRNSSKESPLFLFLHYFDPHPTYLCHRPEISHFETECNGTIEGELHNVKEGIPQEDLRHIIALYDSEIRHTDRQIGRLVAFLREADLYDDALILFFADHGEEFLDHGGNFHGHTLYNELIAVPIILKLPHQKKQISINYPVSLVDMMPTMLEYLKIKLPAQLSGQSLIEGGSVRKNLQERDIYFETEIKQSLKGLMRGNYKIIRDVQRDTYQAYNIKKDFGEEKDLFRLSDPRLSSLRERLDQYCGRIKNASDAPIPEIDEDTKEQLRALGYL